MPFEYQFIQREKEQLHVEFVKLARQLDMKQKLEMGDWATKSIPNCVK